MSLVAFAFFSCQKTDTTPSTNTQVVYAQPTMTATINGVPTVFISSLNLGSGGGYIQILGVSSYLGLTINIPVPTDTISYTSYGVWMPSVQVDSSSTGYGTVIGTPSLKVTQYNSATGIFSGTFSCTLKAANGKQKVITNGMFSNF